jgi:hypothetical protein
MRKVLFVLAAHSDAGQHLGNCISSRDLIGSLKLAECFLRLTPAAAYVDVIAWRAGVEWAKAQASETVHRDREREEV